MCGAKSVYTAVLLAVDCTESGLCCRRGRRFVFNIGDDELENFVCQSVHFGEYLCDNWSTEWVHFALLNTAPTVAG